MTQTENLKLNTWAESDPVNVGQINQNFQKIDVLGKRSKLMEINDTSGGANQINVNLTGISLRDYAYLELCGSFSGYTSSSPSLAEVRMRLNGLSTAMYARKESSNGYATDMMSLYGSAGYLNGSFCTFTLRIYAEKSFIVADQYAVGFCNFNSSNLRPHQEYSMGVCISPQVTPSTLSQINFFLQNAEKSFYAGTKITVYGVKA